MRRRNKKQRRGAGGRTLKSTDYSCLHLVSRTLLLSLPRGLRSEDAGGGRNKS